MFKIYQMILKYYLHNDQFHQVPLSDIELFSVLGSADDRRQWVSALVLINNTNVMEQKDHW